MVGVSVNCQGKDGSEGAAVGLQRLGAENSGSQEDGRVKDRDAAIIADCNEPSVLQSGKEIKAKVSYGQRHLAKAAGFHWNSLVPQAWVRHLSTSQRERLPFPVELVDKVNG